MPYRRLVTYYFFYFSFMGVFMPYFGFYLQKKGFSSAEIGMLLSIQQAMRVFAPNMWGWLADRLRCRMPVVRTAAVLSLAGFASILFATQFWSIAVALSVMSFFWTAQSPLMEALTLTHLRATPARYGRVRAWGSFGFIVTTMLMGWWLERASVDSIFPSGIVLLVITIVCAMVLPEAKPSAASHAASGFLAILLRRKVLALLGAFLLLTAAHSTLYVFYTIHLVAAGYSKTVVGVMWMIGVVAEICAFMRAPLLFARFSLRGIVLFACVTAVLRFLLVGWGVHSPVIVALAQVMHGITFGAAHVAAVAAIHEWFGDANQAQGQAAYGSVSYGVGGIIGSVVSGWMWDRVGPGWTYTAGSVLALLALIVVYFGWKPEMKRELRNA